MCYGGCRCKRCAGPDEERVPKTAMTRKEDLAQRAKEITEQLLAGGVCLSDGECEITDRVILQALQQVEREVWEKVIITLEESKTMSHHTISPHIGPLWTTGWTSCAKHFASWFRKQQKELG